MWSGGRITAMLSHVIAGQRQSTDYRMFINSAVWSPGQLQSEVDQGVWSVVSSDQAWARVREGASQDDLGDGVWHTFMKSLGQSTCHSDCVLCDCRDSAGIVT